MAKNESDYISDPDSLAKKLKDIVREIHEELDPHEMNAYKRFFKRHVSVFSRAYFNAYLLRRLDRGNVPARRSAPEFVENADTTTLFVSVGKNRKVYPKDIIALFAENDAVDASNFGQIKVLDNYSFVDVDRDVAETVIGAFDGIEYRGRKLTVNHARKKN